MPFRRRFIHRIWLHWRAVAIICSRIVLASTELSGRENQAVQGWFGNSLSWNNRNCLPAGSAPNLSAGIVPSNKWSLIGDEMDRLLSLDHCRTLQVFQLQRFQPNWMPCWYDPWQLELITIFVSVLSGTGIPVSSLLAIPLKHFPARAKEKMALAKRPRSDGSRQPQCCTAPAQKIWWCYCRPDCLAQNASLQVQQHNSKPSLLTAVVTAPCVARRQPTNQLDK